MSNLPQNRSLAYEIGLCRIAMVVDQVHRQMKTHHVLAELFHVRGDWGSRRARLTYFWWVVLGGNKLRAIDLELIPKDVRTGITPELLRDWLALFRQAALPIIGGEFTSAWMGKAERLARKFLITDKGDAVKLARAS